jgi:hypothetical protein
MQVKFGRANGVFQFLFHKQLPKIHVYDRNTIVDSIRAAGGCFEAFASMGL